MWSKLDRITDADWRANAKQANYCSNSLAQRCEVSRRQLERYFKTQFKQSPRAWLRRLRMEEARRLLSEGLSSKAAAYELGFKRPSHFSREFRHQVGVCPTAFALSANCPRRWMSQLDQ